MNLIEHFTPRKVEAGAVKVDSTVSFTIENSTGMEIESYQKSCGCLGTVTIVGNKDLHCELQAQAKGTLIELYQYGDRYLRWFPQMPEGRRLYDVINKVWIMDTVDIDLLEKVGAYEFNQVLTINLKDGNPMHKVSESGELVDEAAKAKVSIPVNMYVLKQD